MGTPGRHLLTLALALLAALAAAAPGHTHEAEEACPHRERWRPAPEELRATPRAQREWLDNGGNPAVPGRAVLCNADLREVQLDRTRLGDADLSRADLRGAKLRFASLGATGLGASAALRGAVTVEGVFRRLRAFHDIATGHGGHRAAGTPGYDASAGYVAGALRGAGYAVELQEFSFPYFEQTAAPVLRLVDAGGAAAGGPVVAEGQREIRTLVFSGSGEVTARVEPVEFAAPGRANGSTSGCEAADFRGFGAGSIALVRRGTCPFQAKVENAVAAGAVGVVVANDGAEGRTDAFPGRLRGPADVPVVGVGAAPGERLERAARRPEGATARLAVAAEMGERSTRNVIAETPGGDPERVIVVGAHLDSVPEGPGINDNGSGAAVVLETAVQMARLGIEPARRVRFAFWGAEELGLLGSRRYVDGLSERNRARIAAVLNFDMLGSPDHGRFIYDGDGSDEGRGGPEGSAAIERVFEDYFRAAGLPAEPIAVDGGSDHAAFAAAGIAVGGLYAGGRERRSAAQAALFGGEAGRRFDPCQHRACDTIDNVSARAIGELADAAAHAVLALALDDRGLADGRRRAGGRAPRSRDLLRWPGSVALSGARDDETAKPAATCVARGRRKPRNARALAIGGAPLVRASGGAAPTRSRRPTQRNGYP